MPLHREALSLKAWGKKEAVNQLYNPGSNKDGCRFLLNSRR